MLNLKHKVRVSVYTMILNKPYKVRPAHNFVWDVRFKLKLKDEEQMLCRQILGLHPSTTLISISRIGVDALQWVGSLHIFTIRRKVRTP